MKLKCLIVAAALATAPAWAQQAPQAKTTTEQQARSYILSAFMTGAAPTLLSQDAKVPLTLRERLDLSPESDSRAVYYAMARLTAGKSFRVRPARSHEMELTETKVEPGKPVFALEVSESTFVLQYDLERDLVTHLADASRPVAVTSPVSAPEPPQPIVEAAQAAKPAAAEPPPATQTPAPLQVVEPREPVFNKPVARPASVAAPAVQMTREEPRLPRLRPSGPCVIKAVMSDQDLVNCGATPR
jgi:hypothetical protein